MLWFEGCDGDGGLLVMFGVGNPQQGWCWILWHLCGYMILHVSQHWNLFKCETALKTSGAFIKSLTKSRLSFPRFYRWEKRDQQKPIFPTRIYTDELVLVQTHTPHLQLVSYGKDRVGVLHNFLTDLAAVQEAWFVPDADQGTKRLHRGHNALHNFSNLQYQQPGMQIVCASFLSFHKSGHQCTSACCVHGFWFVDIHTRTSSLCFRVSWVWDVDCGFGKSLANFVAITQFCYYYCFVITFQLAFSEMFIIAYLWLALWGLC